MGTDHVYVLRLISLSHHSKVCSRCIYFSMRTHVDTYIRLCCFSLAMMFHSHERHVSLSDRNNAKLHFPTWYKSSVAKHIVVKDTHLHGNLDEYQCGGGFILLHVVLGSVHAVLIKVLNKLQLSFIVVTGDTLRVTCRVQLE